VSNRTDFDTLASELAEMFGLTPEATARIEDELHNAYVAGEEGHGCECSACRRERERTTKGEPQ
jgi:hypothetical protein